MPAHEIAETMQQYLALMKNGSTHTEAVSELARVHNRPEGTIHSLIMRLRPTVDVAKMYLQSQALRMAARVVRDAKVPEIIDVLSRSDMGVIAPKQESGGQGGFFVAISADSCGAVKVGISNTAPQQLAPPSPSVIDYTPEPAPVHAAPILEAPARPSMRTPGVPHTTQSGFLKKTELTERQQMAIDARRRRLTEARRARGKAQFAVDKRLILGEDYAESEDASTPAAGEGTADS